jgi:PiT family inorganic phosphate transporter
MFYFLIIIIAMALIFDFINGFHDAANSIATVVSTKVLSPLTAVLWAATFNFIAFWLFQLAVADTVSKTVQPEFITLNVIFAGLIGAIAWNLFTWWKGIPSSSSHTLMGGFAGAAIANAGFDVLKYEKIWPVLVFIVFAPLIGMVVSYLISVLLLWICRRGKPSNLEAWFKRFQLLSSALFSLGHGGNDAQKVMGIIMAAFIAFSHLSPEQAKGAPEWLTAFSSDFFQARSRIQSKKQRIQSKSCTVQRCWPTFAVRHEKAGTEIHRHGSDLGSDFLLYRNRIRNAVWRLANRKDDGKQNHKDDSV